MTSWSTCVRLTWQRTTRWTSSPSGDDSRAWCGWGEQRSGAPSSYRRETKVADFLDFVQLWRICSLWSFESKVDDPPGFQGPPAQAAVEKEQGSSQIPGLTILSHPHLHPHPYLYPHHCQTFRFYVTSHPTLKSLSIINFFLSVCTKGLAINLLLRAGHKTIPKLNIEIEISLAGH